MAELKKIDFPGPEYREQGNRDVQKNIRVVVYGSSQPKPGSGLYEDARALGSALAGAGWTVATGGYSGVMEAVSRGAKEAGGATIGVTTAFYPAAKKNSYMDIEIRMPAYGDRLLELTRSGDAFIVMRGGSGTLAELFLTWELEKNTSISPGPIILYGAHWRTVIGFLAGEFPEELAFSSYIGLLHFAETPEEAVGIIRTALGLKKEN